jgi:hypothetical protein
MMLRSITEAASGSGGVVAGLGAGVGAIGIAFKFVETVHEGEMAVKERFGRPLTYTDEEGQVLHKIKGPGKYFTFPFAHRFHKIETRDQVERFEQEINCSRGIQWAVGTRAIWAVSEQGEAPYRALYSVKDKTELKQKVLGACEQAMFETLNGADSEDFRNPSNLADIDSTVKVKSRAELDDMGVMLRRVGFWKLTETSHEMQRQTMFMERLLMRESLGEIVRRSAQEVGGLAVAGVDGVEEFIGLDALPGASVSSLQDYSDKMSRRFDGYQPGPHPFGA